VQIALQDLAYDKIRELIMETKQLSPGKLYSESALSKQLRISRTPVRRALQKFEQEGLVVILPQRGFYVYQFTEKDICEIFQLRKLLEGFAIEWICKTDKDVNLDLVRNNMKAQEEARILNNFGKFSLQNKKFHQEIVKVTGNDRLYKAYKDLRLSMDAVGLQLLRNRENWQWSIDDHKLILEAIEKRDHEEAKKMLYSHFDASERTLRNGIRQLAGNKK
jgi:DNA-binding GntR family transcriptional regulator